MWRTRIDTQGDLLAGQVCGSHQAESESDDKLSMAKYRLLATHFDDHSPFRRTLRKFWPYDDFSNLQIVHSHGMVGGHKRLGPNVVEPVDYCLLKVLIVRNAS